MVASQSGEREIMIEKEESASGGERDSHGVVHDETGGETEPSKDVESSK